MRGRQRDERGQTAVSSDVTGKGPVARERFLTVTEAAAYLNTSERFVRRLIAERRVAFHRVGRHIRFRQTDLEEFVLAGRVEPITRASVRQGLVVA